MAFAPVDSRYNGPRLEKTILEFWESHSIFEQTLRQSADRPRFSFCEGPPTANGKPGIHHVLARAFKDIYPRYKTMRGYYAPRKGGWDAHGLPVEHEIEKRLGIFDKKDIEARVGIEEFNRLCRQSVMTYIGEWEEMTRRMGYWVNLDEAYYTLDNAYIESVWSLLKTIWDKGLIYQGYKVVPYDPRIGATLSSHEVAQGYREVEDPSIIVRFRLDGGELQDSTKPTSFLVWTTTPWTLPANLLLAVGADIDYVRVECDDEFLILAAERMDAVLGDISYVRLGSFAGSDLVGQRYCRLFDDLSFDSGDPFRVVAADFVSVDDGTGIVHVAPAYGVDDLAVGQRENLPVVHGVGLDGCFKPEVKFIAGMFFKDADAVICRELAKRKLLFCGGKIRHNYPFGWRTGDPLIYYAKEAWYIKTTAVKERMAALNQTINWVPATIRDGRFGNWLDNNIDWALSRERFWGTPLPVWRNKTGDCICIGSLAELEALVGRPLGEVDLHRPQIDAITFEKDGETYTRAPEVIDCWFDSGAMSYAQWHYPFENRATFEQHFPADYICEAIDQTRGWFYTLHAIAALVSDSVAYKNCVCLSHIVDSSGKKMSKSQGNIVNPYDVFDTIGVDSLRWLFLARTAPEAQKRISVDIVREVASSFVNTFWNTYAFFILYARLDKVDLSRRIALSKRPEIDRWALALAHQTVRDVTEALDNYDAKGAGESIEKLVDQLSNWYVRRCRRRFWKSEHGDDKQAAYLTLFECIDICHRLMAPFMPFLSEAVYLNLHGNGGGVGGDSDAGVGVDADSDAGMDSQVDSAGDCASSSNSGSELNSDSNTATPQSVHLTAWPKCDARSINPQLVQEMDIVQQAVGLGRAAREDSRVRIRQPLSRMLVGVADPAARAAIEKHQAQLREELNIKAVQFIAAEAQLVSYVVKPNFATLGRRHGTLMPAIKTALAQLDPTATAAIAAAVAAGENFTCQVAGATLSFAAADIKLETTAAKGYACAQAAGFLVALDITLNEALLTEGISRELVRSVQDTRKSADLKISDRINLNITGTPRVEAALKNHRQYIMSETLAATLTVTLAPSKKTTAFTADRALGEDNWRIVLAKH